MPSGTETIMLLCGFMTGHLRLKSARDYIFMYHPKTVFGFRAVRLMAERAQSEINQGMLIFIILDWGIAISLKLDIPPIMHQELI